MPVPVGTPQSRSEGGLGGCIHNHGIFEVSTVGSATRVSGRDHRCATRGLSHRIERLLELLDSILQILQILLSGQLILPDMLLNLLLQLRHPETTGRVMSSSQSAGDFCIGFFT